MKIKTSELTGAALDWAVAKCEGRRIESPNGGVYWPELCNFSPRQNWAQAGEIIEREGLTVSDEGTMWSSYIRKNLFKDDGSECWQTGTTPTIAAMRCFVSSRLGDEVDVPDELLGGTNPDTN